MPCQEWHIKGYMSRVNKKRVASQVGLVVAFRKSLKAPFLNSEIEIFYNFQQNS